MVDSAMCPTRRRKRDEPDDIPASAKDQSLGDALRVIRNARGLTLREVEEVTTISNAYLSQLETGKIDKPNPNFLYRLAQTYAVPYQMLMERAGYIHQLSESESSKKGRPRSLPGAALATVEDLTDDEASELMNYLAFLRSRRSKRKPG